MYHPYGAHEDACNLSTTGKRRTGVSAWEPSVVSALLIAQDFPSCQLTARNHGRSFVHVVSSLDPCARVLRIHARGQNYKIDFSGHGGHGHGEQGNSRNQQLGSPGPEGGGQQINISTGKRPGRKFHPGI